MGIWAVQSIGESVRQKSINRLKSLLLESKVNFGINELLSSCANLCQCVQRLIIWNLYLYL
jgi:hypothetical protein